MDELKLEKAQEVYNTLCAALDARKWVYDKHQEDLVVTFGVRGDDLPMRYVVGVDADRQLIRLSSPLPFQMKEDKRVEGAIITTVATYAIADGCFDYDMTDGEICFRLTAPFMECEVREGLFHHLISLANHLVDEFNDKFMAVNNGLWSIKDFLEKT